MTATPSRHSAPTRCQRFAHRLGKSPPKIPPAAKPRRATADDARDVEARGSGPAACRCFRVLPTRPGSLRRAASDRRRCPPRPASELTPGATGRRARRRVRKSASAPAGTAGPGTVRSGGFVAHRRLLPRGRTSVRREVARRTGWSDGRACVARCAIALSQIRRIRPLAGRISNQ
jgi:hypothetical protein